MAKSPAERKAAQRARQSESGNRKFELVLDEQELEMLAHNCAARRPGRAPPVALVVRRMKCQSTSRCLFARTMLAFVAASGQSALTAVVSAAMSCRLSRVRAMVIRNAG